LYEKKLIHKNDDNDDNDDTDAAPRGESYLVTPTTERTILLCMPTITWPSFWPYRKRIFPSCKWSKKGRAGI
jgi:hypothetical protein